MSERILPAALKPVILGFVIGFLLVGIARMADAGEAADDAMVSLKASAPRVAGGHWVSLR